MHRAPDFADEESRILNLSHGGVSLTEVDPEQEEVVIQDFAHAWLANPPAVRRFPAPIPQKNAKGNPVDRRKSTPPRPGYQPHTHRPGDARSGDPPPAFMQIVDYVQVPETASPSRPVIATDRRLFQNRQAKNSSLRASRATPTRRQRIMSSGVETFWYTQ
jgi:hypothetical protein